MKTSTDTKQLRSFGFMVGGVFILIGLWPLIRGEGPRLWALIVGGLLVIPAAIFPRSLEYAYRAWMAVGHILGWINTRIILSVIFGLIITPFGIVRRWFGPDTMRRKIAVEPNSYRQRRDPRPASHMKRQY
jgi:hypothetical protein